MSPCHRESGHPGTWLSAQSPAEEEKQTMSSGSMAPMRTDPMLPSGIPIVP